MSEQNYLEKLLDGADVKWMRLDNIVELKRGRRLVKNQLETYGKFAVYQNSMTPSVIIMNVTLRRVLFLSLAQAPQVK